MKKNIKLFGWIAFTALILNACATEKKEEVIDMAKVKAEIQAMEDAYAAGETNIQEEMGQQTNYHTLPRRLEIKNDEKM